jgi:hypothetical protein
VGTTNRERILARCLQRAETEHWRMWQYVADQIRAGEATGPIPTQAWAGLVDVPGTLLPNGCYRSCRIDVAPDDSVTVVGEIDTRVIYQPQEGSTP